MKTKSNPFLRSALFTATLAYAGVSNSVQAAINTYQWNGTTTSDWATLGNWAASPGIGASGASSDSRLNVYNGTGQRLIYSATQGTTVYANTAGRGLVVSNASGSVAGSMEIIGGSFSTLGSTQADVIGNNATGSLTVSGNGSFIGAGSSAGGTVVGLNSGGGTSTLTVSGTGSATFTTLQLSAATAVVNLDGGTLTANQIVDVDNSGVTANSNTTFNFNGGTLTAGPGAVTAFMTGLTNAFVKSGGAVINTAGSDITIAQALLDFTTPSGGGLTKSGSGTLTLTGNNSYTGTTTVTEGTLSLGNGTSNTNLSDLSTVNIASGAIVNLNFTGTDMVGKLIIDGNTLPSGVYDGSLATPEPYRSYFTGAGSLTVLNQNGTWTSTVDGNWSTSANWDSNVIAGGSDKTATFSAGTGTESITVTLDTSRAIGNLAFSNANYTLAGGNTLTLDVTSTSTPAISVASGLNATVSSNLAGTQGLEKTGPGTLTLSGVKSYTGGTTVTDGTLAMGSTAPSNTCPIQGLLTVNTGGTLRLDTIGFGFAGAASVSNVSLNTANLVVNSAAAVHMGFNGQTNLYLADGSSITPATAGNTVQFAIKNIDSTGNSQNTISANLNLRTDGNAGQHTFYVDGGGAAIDLLLSGNLSDQWPQQTSIPAASLTKTGTGTMVISGTNTYNGNTIVSDGILEFASTSQLQFVVTDAPAANQVTGSGAATFNGSFNIDTTAVSGITGHIWLLVDRATLTGESFGSTFSVAGFDDSNNDGLWLMTDAKGNWSFDETTGELTLDIGSDYDDWVTANGVVGGENDDDDNDGLTNHEEYAFGLDPTGGSSVNPITGPLNKTSGPFAYQRRTTA